MSGKFEFTVLQGNVPEISGTLVNPKCMNPVRG